jgi:hypothetical protein
MKAKIRYAGINDSESAKNLSDMIHKARKKAHEERNAKRSFIETAEREEAKNIALGFSQA